MTGINYCIEAIAPIRINCAVSTHYHILYLLTHVPDYNNYCFDYNWVGACIEEVPDNVGGAIVLYIFDMDGHPPFWLHTGNPGACNSDADTYTFDYGENIYLIGGMGVFYYHCVNLGYPYYFYLKIESLDPPYESYEENFLSNTESLNIFSGFFNINTFCSQHGITLDEGKYQVTLGAYDCEQFYDDNGNIVDHAYRSLNIKTMYIVECPYSRNITDDIYDSYIGQAESYIVANNYIETSEKVIYKAQDYIKLTAGFNAKVTGDGQFITSIGPCGVGCNDLKLLSASPYSDNYTINLAENLKIDSNNFIENFESEKNELSSEENTIIFPNPFNNNIQIINPYKNISINVFDISSYNVFSKEYLYKNKIDLDFSELASGTYFIKIISEENIITKKIIKM